MGRKYNQNQKLGHQAPTGLIQTKYFNSVEIRGDFAHCTSHNFIYHPEKEKELLYNAQPCYYTDKRFVDNIHNYYNNTHLIWKRFKDLSLKSCLRLIKNCHNIPKGTIVEVRTSWYYPKKKVDTAYLYKIRKENVLAIEYKIDMPAFYKNFTSCEFSKALTNKLRENGFIVEVFANSNFLSDMLNTAAAYTGQQPIMNSKEDGEVAIAYGHGKKIGFSSYDNTLFGYGNGCHNILWDRFGEFDKWSRCNEIKKTDSLEDIIAALKSQEQLDYGRELSNGR